MISWFPPGRQKMGLVFIVIMLCEVQVYPGQLLPCPKKKKIIKGCNSFINSSYAFISSASLLLFHFPLGQCEKKKAWITFTSQFPPFLHLSPHSLKQKDDVNCRLCYYYYFFIFFTLTIFEKFFPPQIRRRTPKNDDALVSFGSIFLQGCSV